MQFLFSSYSPSFLPRSEHAIRHTTRIRMQVILSVRVIFTIVAHVYRIKVLGLLRRKSHLRPQMFWTRSAAGLSCKAWRRCSRNKIPSGQYLRIPFWLTGAKLRWLVCIKIQKIYLKSKARFGFVLGWLQRKRIACPLKTTVEPP